MFTLASTTTDQLALPLCTHDTYTFVAYFLGSCLPLSCVYILENLAPVGIKTCFAVVRQKWGKEKPDSHQESKNSGFLD